ncbi:MULTISPECIES: hypothetical protein [unclassified Paenibacillus]|uniref:hypothetical protein n=1 Tax=unclassified Paenibacillus TaxID=185978 RepID=UPI001C10F1FD|nr:MULTISPECIES: hypothetical protein [unclassified Paenibacillus]MBU5445550.1 hypothetical protein [Paenibacillus sp. MSJ-34]CAH0122660.1 hypothetical protein PAE9249_05244 [Paenibacillus sp. CECT 9249]
MRYPIKLDGFEGQAVEVQAGFSKPRLFVNNQLVPMKKRIMTLKRNDGTEATAAWKPKFLGLDIPDLIVDGKEIQVAKPLHWVFKVWSVLPIFLFLGGLFGGLIGILAITFNFAVFRISANLFLKFFITLLISVAAVLAYYFIATVFLISLA